MIKITFNSDQFYNSENLYWFFIQICFLASLFTGFVFKAHQQSSVRSFGDPEALSLAKDNAWSILLKSKQLSKDWRFLALQAAKACMFLLPVSLWQPSEILCANPKIMSNSLNSGSFQQFWPILEVHFAMLDNDLKQMVEVINVHVL